MTFPAAAAGFSFSEDGLTVSIDLITELGFPSPMVYVLSNLDFGSVSLRVQKEDIYLNPGIEFWR